MCTVCASVLSTVTSGFGTNQRSKSHHHRHRMYGSVNKSLVSNWPLSVIGSLLSGSTYSSVINRYALISHKIIMVFIARGVCALSVFSNESAVYKILLLANASRSPPHRLFIFRLIGHVISMVRI